MYLKAMFMSNQIIQVFSSSSHATEEDLLAAITNRVAEFLETDLELLMSYLYRLDILESDINFVMNHQNDVPVSEGLGKLIFDKQLKRTKYREQYKQAPIEGWDEW